MVVMRVTYVLLLAMLATGGEAWAHHSFAAEYDSSKPITITGNVTKVEWTNPHARLYVDVKDDKGNVTNWNFELGGPLQLNRLGWHRESVKAGDQIKVEGYAAKDGSNMANVRNVIFADGRKVYAGTQGEGAPPQDAPKDAPKENAPKEKDSQ
jgi:hypothetical protein